MPMFVNMCHFHWTISSFICNFWFMSGTQDSPLFSRGTEGEKEKNRKKSIFGKIFIFICKIRIIFTGILWRKVVNSSKVRVWIPRKQKFYSNDIVIVWYFVLSSKRLHQNLKFWVSPKIVGIGHLLKRTKQNELRNKKRHNQQTTMVQTS